MAQCSFSTYARDGLLFAASQNGISIEVTDRRMLQDMGKSWKIRNSSSIAVNMNSHKLPGYHMLSMDMQGHSHMSHMGHMGHMYRLHVYRTRQLSVRVSVRHGDDAKSGFGWRWHPPLLPDRRHSAETCGECGDYTDEWMNHDEPTR